jgi:hypothetical protein
LNSRPVNNCNPRQNEKMQLLIDYLKGINKEGLTGYIKINFNQGNICKVERYEEVLRK